MKNGKFLAILLCGVLALSMTACSTPAPASSAAPASQSASAAPAATDPKITLKLGFSTNDTDPRAIASAEFKKLVEEKTGGSVTVELYPSGQLGGDAALIEALSLDSGSVDVIVTDASNFATYEPKMGISALPFQFADFETAWKFMDSDIVKHVEESLITQNMRVLAHFDNGFRCVTTGKVEVKTPDDMKNMLIRTPENPVIMATMRALGANPQPLAFSELYMALQQGTYDAQENPVPVIYNNKLYEVQKNLTVTNHIYSGMCFTIGESVFQKMSDSQRTIVQDAAKAAEKVNRDMNKQMTTDMLAKLESEGGMVIQKPDLAPFVAATAGVKKDLAAQYGEDLLKQVDDWLAAN